ncbi:MAG: hypothetical protein ACTS85_02595 [Arsenophonus sp. NC-PG7-MAG3]
MAHELFYAYNNIGAANLEISLQLYSKPISAPSLGILEGRIKLYVLKSYPEVLPNVILTINNHFQAQRAPCMHAILPIISSA